MGEQLSLLEMGGNISAEVHVVGSMGIHSSIYVHGLGETSLSAVLEARDIEDGQAVYRNIHRVNHVAWIDFPRAFTDNPDQCWIESQLNTTYLAASREQRAGHRYSFKSVSELLDEGSVPEYTVRWLRKFMVADRPHPPIGPKRTDAIRSVVPLLPPLSSPLYIQRAVRQMPFLASHYRQFGHHFSGV